MRIDYINSINLFDDKPTQITQYIKEGNCVRMERVVKQRFEGKKRVLEEYVYQWRENRRLEIAHYVYLLPAGAADATAGAPV